MPLRVQSNGPGISELPDLRLWPPAGGQPAAASLTDQLLRLRPTVPWNLYWELCVDICTEHRLGGSAEWGDKGRVDGENWGRETFQGLWAYKVRRKT